ncbi:MAG: hypothetical protein R2909_14885 [Gemmatimonadales bacterium]
MTHAAGQAQSGPQAQASPQRQPARRREEVFDWQPQVQLAPSQERQEQVLAVFDMGSSLTDWLRSDRAIVATLATRPVYGAANPPS